jgi:MFS family permease
LAAGHEWQVYLPVFVISMGFAVPFIILAEKKRKMKQVFLGAIAVLIMAELGLSFFHQNLVGIIGFLGLFFCGFNLLEATLPSLISKTAPADLKGTAMGAYSSSQFMGLFIGGLVGGWFNGEFGVSAVFLFCASALFSWFLVSLNMKSPRYVANLLISLEKITEQEAAEFIEKMLKLKGVEEILLHYEEALVYLKVDNQQLDKDQLQGLITQYVNAGKLATTP